MENTSLPNDVWDNITTSSSKDNGLTQLYLAHIRYVALKVVYIIIGTVGVLDNLFVIIVFALFIKITDKVSAILNSFHSVSFVAIWCCFMYRRVKSFKQTVFLSQHCVMSKVTSFLSAIFRPWQSFCHLFIALLIIRCSKSAQKFTVQVCQVAAETTQLVLSRSKNF